MRKRKLIFVAVSIVVAITAGVGLKSSKLDQNLTDIQLMNVEALVNDEQDCHNTNGYRQWKKNKPWPWSNMVSFRDCCMVQQDGYSPKEECH